MASDLKVIVIGGGWSGVAAAIAAKKAGADVEVFEKTDLLLGLGNVGGIMRNNGRYTATEELIAMGGSELFNITDKLSSTISPNRMAYLAIGNNIYYAAIP